jgi:hypothetical protein
MYNSLISGYTKLQQVAVNDKARLNPLQWTGKDIVKYVLLLLCAGEVTFDYIMSLMISSSSMALKKHLFYLIDYDIISYGGQKQVYYIKDKGLE